MTLGQLLEIVEAAEAECRAPIPATFESFHKMRRLLGPKQIKKLLHEHASMIELRDDPKSKARRDNAGKSVDDVSAMIDGFQSEDAS